MNSAIADLLQEKNMNEFDIKARQGRKTALERVRSERLNMFAERGAAPRHNVGSVIARLSDLRIRMGRRRMAFGQMTGDFGAPLRLR